MSVRGQPQRTVNEALVHELRQMFPAMTYREIAARAGCSAASVANVLNARHYSGSSNKKPPPAPIVASKPRPRVTDPTLLRKLTAGRAS